jgi:hypothetical protein
MQLAFFNWSMAQTDRARLSLICIECLPFEAGASRIPDLGVGKLNELQMKWLLDPPPQLTIDASLFGAHHYHV